ncbi:MAG: hypothetical protein ACRCWB_09575 [Enterovibrio sp.]
MVDFQHWLGATIHNSKVEAMFLKATKKERNKARKEEIKKWLHTPIIVNK